MSMDAFEQLRALTLLTIALLLAPAAIPPLRRYRSRLQVAMLLLYFGGAAVILALWLLRR
ncbi:conserved protein of unknown function [Rhodovastum atsumiense]|uniref:Uncharacterized protein n=1 Tax=Rhodovastum atsumiense TaxID=504468 RepID=A0A5M6IKW4_9PROT|nr:hypothetical protein [Rhodovastum atsumiense]KAA5608913.1 hypothetical protein F1189_26630 [Rhodovastum atsumiense]CAH2604237.1 conserved protein of unknown function [Rhodovastum atsumiense]